jgi:alginate O-acetyltransferase complex protein AlgI
MLFNSFQFFLFFPIVTALYFLLPKNNYRIGLLLLASCYFYMAFKPIYILILFLLIVIDYSAGLLISGSTGNKRKLFLILSIVANLSMLCFFKYYSFIVDNIEASLHLFDSSAKLPHFNVLLPIGLSFHTFQSMSYTIEVFRNNSKAEKNIGIFALYVLFYPQLVAGPIERPQNLLHQFRKKHAFTYENMIAGLKLMLWGFFKKVVIADKLAVGVNEIYSNPDSNHGFILLIGAIFFSFQIYCDFSGYSDIAIGAARTMGFNLMQNFNRPFISKNITEFYRRWHISLSTWLRDYLFTPLAVNTRGWGKVGILFSLFLTFFLCGLWHGAGWTYIAYGVIHSFCLIYDFLTTKFRKKLAKEIPQKLYNGFSIISTFFIITFSLIVFRANSINSAWKIVKQIFISLFVRPEFQLPNDFTMNTITNPKYLITCITYIIFLLTSEHLFGANVLLELHSKLKFKKIRWSFYYILLLLLFFSENVQQSFIYFQF